MCHRESGFAVLLTVAVLLPILFLLSALAIDLALYFDSERKIQIILDEATLFAHRYLPYRAQAIAAAQHYVARFDNVAPHVTVSIADDMVSARFEGQFPLFFGSLGSASAGGGISSLAIPLRTWSVARGQPVDTFIAIDSSRYLAPELSSAAWASPGASQPALFFSQHPVTGPGGIAVPPLVATQQCFNPAYAALKRAALSLYDRLSAGTTNGVGLGFYPGADMELVEAHPVLPASAAGRGDLGFEARTGWPVSNEHCLAAAEEEPVNSPAYAAYTFPQRDSNLPAPAPLSQLLPVTRVQRGTPLRLDPSYPLNAQEVVWARAVNPGDPADFVSVTRELLNRLLSVPVTGQRGGTRRFTAAFCRRLCRRRAVDQR